MSHPVVYCPVPAYNGDNSPLWVTAEQVCDGYRVSLCDSVRVLSRGLVSENSVGDALWVWVGGLATGRWLGVGGFGVRLLSLRERWLSGLLSG